VVDFTPHTYDPTAFMSGQVGSKLWLCEKLEPMLAERYDRNVIVWLLGGWYAMTSFLLQTRRRAPIAKVVSFDLDPEATKGALIFNEAFLHQGTFDAFVADVHVLHYDVEDAPDVVVNTSTEHMESDDWFHRIPDGTLCVFQSNNMPHDDHVHECSTAQDLARQFPLKQTLFLGAKTFHYPEWGFTRFMHIGVK
jgi:hypothetical protein